MKPHFNLSADFDVRLLPYSPANESDELEIRMQAYNAGGDGSLTVEFFLDEISLGGETLAVSSGTYGFARKYVSLAGKAGEHTVTVKIASDGEVVNGIATLPLTVIREPKVVLDGGFIMLGPPNDRVCCDSFRETLKSFTDDDWRRYISEMHKIGQDCIIIMVAHQYLEIEKKSLVAHYPSKLMPKSDIRADDPIGAILDEAERNGQKVFLGVGNNYGYDGTPEEVRELFERYSSYRAFYGWYFALELQMNLTTDYGVKLWHRYDEIAKAARELSPVKPIMLSPFEMPTPLFHKVFHSLGWIDIIMPQDWAGQCRFTIEDSREMHRRLSEFCRENRCHFWANCESFNFSEPNLNGYLVPRFRGGGMVGEEGFDKQMLVTRPYVEKIMNFMLSGFFTPPGFTPVCGGEASVKQYADYVNYVEKIKNKETAQ